MELVYATHHVGSINVSVKKHSSRLKRWTLEAAIALSQ
jgi:hypothetical protein